MAYSQGNQDPERCWGKSLIQAPSPFSLEREAEWKESLPLRAVVMPIHERSPLCRALELCGHLGNMGLVLGYDAQAQMTSWSP